MVKVSIEIDKEKSLMYMDGRLYKELTESVKPRVQKKDMDYFLIVDGEEGSGKSTLAFQIAKVLSPTFNQSNIAFTPEEFIKAVTSAKKHDCIVFDEAFTGLSSRKSLSETNNLLVELMMECRQKNLYVIIVMPSIFFLEKYVVLHRARCLFNTRFNRDGGRGPWFFWNKDRMKLLYLLGKKLFDYKVAKPQMWGTFLEKYTVNEKIYRKVKRESLEKKKRTIRVGRFKQQRNDLLYILSKEYELDQPSIVELLKKYNVGIHQSTLSRILATFTDKYANFETEQENTCDI